MTWHDSLTTAQREVVADALDTYLLALSLAGALATEPTDEDEVAWKHYLATELRSDLKGPQ